MKFEADCTRVVCIFSWIKYFWGLFVWHHFNIHIDRSKRVLPCYLFLFMHVLISKKWHNERTGSVECEEFMEFRFETHYNHFTVLNIRGCSKIAICHLLPSQTTPIDTKLSLKKSLIKNFHHKNLDEIRNNNLINWKEF